MAKKTDTTTKSTAPAKQPIAPAKQPVKTAAKKKPAAKSAKASPAKKAKPAAKKAATAAYTGEDVALRAYFIAEKRHAHGIPGNEHQDWVEAERQLAAESGKAKKAKKA